MKAEDPARTITLRPGYNFPTWPILKYEHGGTITRELQGRFLEWSSSRPLLTRSVILDDRQTVETFLVVRSAPPLDEWSLLLGDAIHAYRSALDALAWSMATFDGATPSHPRLVQFPVCETEQHWAAAMKSWISELPQQFIDRLRATQQFDVPAGAVNPLVVLHKLDLTDKHRSSIEAQASIAGLALDNEAQLVDPSAELAVAVTYANPSAPLDDGTLILRVDYGALIESTTVALIPVTELVLEVDGQHFKVPEILAAITAYVDGALRHCFEGPRDESLEWRPLPGFENGVA